MVPTTTNLHRSKRDGLYENQLQNLDPTPGWNQNQPGANSKLGHDSLQNFYLYDSYIHTYIQTENIDIIIKKKKIIIEGKVCHHPKTGYQIWLDLQALKSLGVPFPIGAICTFKEFRLVWLPPSAVDYQKPPFSGTLDKLMMNIATPHKVGWRNCQSVHYSREERHWKHQMNITSKS